MSNSLLVGRSIKVRANEFIDTDLGARVSSVSASGCELLLALDSPLTVSGVTYTHLVASPRLARDNIDILLGGSALGCSVTWVPEKRFDKSKPFDLTWWRGGAAAITDLTVE